MDDPPVPAPVPDQISTIPTPKIEHDRMDASPSNSNSDPPTADPATSTTESSAPLSKSQLKKLRRQQHWADTREAWKAAKKAKRKERKARDREEREKALQAGSKRTLDEDGDDVKSEESKRKMRKVLEPITLVLDCGFDDLMTDKVCSSRVREGGRKRRVG
jgi:tRNA (guanine9-N1)-methyltransferase